MKFDEQSGMLNRLGDKNKPEKGRHIHATTACPEAGK